MKLIKTFIILRLSIDFFFNRITIKMLTASIDEFDQILAIEHWNVAGKMTTERNTGKRKIHYQMIFNMIMLK